MPYVKPKVRRQYSHEAVLPADSAGTLNFLITEEIVGYLQEHRLSYRTINDVLGAVFGAGLEFYRRIAVPYEDSKIEENGDVYPPWRELL